MPELDQLLKDSARQPQATPDVDVIWRGGRRRRTRSAITAGVMALVVIGLTVPRVLGDPSTEVAFVPRASEPTTAGEPGATEPGAAEGTVNEDGTRTLLVGGAEFDVPAGWPVVRVTSHDNAPCLNAGFGGHSVYIADGLYEFACPYEPQAETTAVYATSLSDAQGTFDYQVSGERVLTDHADAFVSRGPGLDHYQFSELDLLLVVQRAEAGIADAIVNSVRPEGFNPPGWSGPPSQSPEDARRDGVPLEVAALPVSVRVDVQDDMAGAKARGPVDEGLWVVSALHPNVSEGLGRQLVEGPVVDGKAEILSIWEYGEVLLMDRTGVRIRRAFPFPGMKPQSILVTPDAIYCVRQGDGGLPDSMVCRIDRRTGETTVRVFPHEPDVDSERSYRRRGWLVDGEHAGLNLFSSIVDGLLPDKTPAPDVIVQGSDGRASVDPETLRLTILSD